MKKRAGSANWWARLFFCAAQTTRITTIRLKICLFYKRCGLRKLFGRKLPRNRIQCKSRKRISHVPIDFCRRLSSDFVDHDRLHDVLPSVRLLWAGILIAQRLRWRLWRRLLFARKNGIHPRWLGSVGCIVGATQRDAPSATPTSARQPTPAKRQVSKPVTTPGGEIHSSNRNYRNYTQGDQARREYQSPREYHERQASYNANRPTNARMQSQNQQNQRYSSQRGEPQPLTPAQMQARRQLQMSQSQQRTQRGQTPQQAKSQPYYRGRSQKPIYTGRAVNPQQQVVAASHQTNEPTSSAPRATQPTTATAAMLDELRPLPNVASPAANRVNSNVAMAGPALTADSDAVESSTHSASPQELPTSGWTARRSSSDTLR
jgi:hypothetical protein